LRDQRVLLVERRAVFPKILPGRYSLVFFGEFSSHVERETRFKVMPITTPLLAVR
jgi:hypothetical protein